MASDYYTCPYCRVNWWPEMGHGCQITADGNVPARIISVSHRAQETREEVMPADPKFTKPVASAAAVPETAAAEVVNKLRNASGIESQWTTRHVHSWLYDEAADLIERQAAQIERLEGERDRLRVGLQSIAEYDCPGGIRRNECPGWAPCAARSALAATAPPSDSQS